MLILFLSSALSERYLYCSNNYPSLIDLQHLIVFSKILKSLLFHFLEIVYPGTMDAEDLQQEQLGLKLFSGELGQLS